jgi:hypothetical protein
MGVRTLNDESKNQFFYATSASGMMKVIKQTCHGFFYYFEENKTSDMHANLGFTFFPVAWTI